MAGGLAQIKRELQKHASAKKAKASSWFFKTGKGQYGEHDRFLGVTVPEQRAVARKFRDLPLSEVVRLLKSSFHEHRLTAVIILGDQFKRGDTEKRKKIYDAYLKNTRYVNNWDIVDSSASYIVGAYLLEKPRAVLYRLARSKNLWEKRIAIIATMRFIDHGEFSDTLKIAEILMNDSHDLIHKAVGWMLRCVGDKDRKTEEAFLKKYAHRMPRTMLRYAIEKFPEKQRRHYLTMSS